MRRPRRFDACLSPLTIAPTLHCLIMQPQVCFAGQPPRSAAQPPTGHLGIYPSTNRPSALAPGEKPIRAVVAWILACVVFISLCRSYAPFMWKTADRFKEGSASLRPVYLADLVHQRFQIRITDEVARLLPCSSSHISPVARTVLDSSSGPCLRCSMCLMLTSN